MPKKILLIDDGELIIKSLKKLLEKSGYHVFVVKNGQDALAMAEEEKFDLIIADIRIPGMNGVETVTSIYENSKTSNNKKILVIFITGYANEESENKANILKPAAYIYKPFDIKDLIVRIQKMATIGTMADGMSHQINNRFYALSLIAGDTIETIKHTDTSKCTAEVKEMLGSINHALKRIEANVIQGGEVVRGLLKYSRKGEEGFEPLELDKILNNTLEMVQYKVKLPEIDIVRNYNSIPKIKGNMTQLEEVFFNFIDNGYDAIVERRTLLKEPGFRGRIAVSAHPKGANLEIAVEDNGNGMREEEAKKVFTPFFTTKTSSRKGTGLGLYVIRKIITDSHRGRINFESAYKVGTRFIIELPVAV